MTTPTLPGDPFEENSPWPQEMGYGEKMFCLAVERDCLASMGLGPDFQPIEPAPIPADPIPAWAMEWAASPHQGQEARADVKAMATPTKAAQGREWKDNSP